MQGGAGRVRPAFRRVGARARRRASGRAVPPDPPPRSAGYRARGCWWQQFATTMNTARGGFPIPWPLGEIVPAIASVTAKRERSRFHPVLAGDHALGAIGLTVYAVAAREDRPSTSRLGQHRCRSGMLGAPVPVAPRGGGRELASEHPCTTGAATEARVQIALCQQQAPRSMPGKGCMNVNGRPTGARTGGECAMKRRVGASGEQQ